MIARTIHDLNSALSDARRAARTIGFVPTMGALHDGHLALVARARRECEIVVASLFVNPTQFNDPRDLAAYPRTEALDVELLTREGASVIFAPSAAEMYPEGFSTTVDVGTITTPLEGHARGAVHFRGVATVVSKLLNIVRPTHAYFGQKDAQQVLVIKRLVRDLNVPVEIVTCPTVREADGLAMSSRNARLSPDARAQALGLSAALATVQLLTTNGERRAALLQAAGTRILAAHGIDDASVDYLAIVNAETLEPLDTVTDGALVAVAAHVGGVRLIDNILLTLA